MQVTDATQYPLYSSPPPKLNTLVYLGTVIGALIVTTSVQAVLQAIHLKEVWIGDFRFWTTILNILSLGVIFWVQYIEHWRLRNPNGVVLFYWLFLLIAYGVKLRSLVSQRLYETHLSYFVAFCVSVGLALVELSLEWIVPKRLSAYDALGDDDECPIEYANVFSILTFSWMTPLMKHGYKEFLTQDDLWNLRKRDTTEATSVAFEEAWAHEREKKKPSLWIAMFRGFGGPYFRGALFKTVSDVLAFVQPQLLRLLITFVDSYRGDNPQPLIRGAAIALAMFSVSVSQTVCLHQYFQRGFETAHKGELSCIVGRVGAGKSSFLQAMLGDLWKTKGEVVLRGTSAYVAQSPWVMNASVKENIVFGYRWDPHFYDRTVKACALIEDFASLPDGDQTEVGERGISLSGGQKARLTLARAVYARADIYLLDDCLSAVDQHVGRHLIDNVFGPKGLLSGKTRILATNSIPVLMEANFVVLLRDGKIIERGTYEQLMAMKGEIASLIRTANNEESQSENESRETESTESPGSDESTTVYGTGPNSEEEEADEAQEGLPQLAPIRPGGGAVRRSSGLSLRRASTASFRGPRGKTTDEEGTGIKTKQTKEFSEQGKVKWNVYGEYAKTSNLIAVAIYMVTLIGAQTAQIGGSVWLKNWSEINGEYGGNPQVGKYIGVYFAFGFGSAAL
ncbi:ATP-binding cassette glutathione S-conjugate transporter ycf1, partial [Cryomyces antarcticus]